MGNNEGDVGHEGAGMYTLGTWMAWYGLGADDERPCWRIGSTNDMYSESTLSPSPPTTLLPRRVGLLRALRPIYIIGVHLLMLLLLLLRELLPVLPLLRGEALPLLRDRLGEVRLALFLRRGVLAVFAAFPAEEDERVLGAFDVVFVALFGAPGGGAGGGGGGGEGAVGGGGRAAREFKGRGGGGGVRTVGEVVGCREREGAGCGRDYGEGGVAGGCPWSLRVLPLKVRLLLLWFDAN